VLKRIVTLGEIAALVGFVIFVTLLLTRDAPEAEPVPVAAPGEEIDGADVYRLRCAGCHGSDGEGRSGIPALGGGAVVTAFPDEADQIDVVTNGTGRMPSFDARLTPEEIEAVVAYTREELSG